MNRFAAAELPHPGSPRAGVGCSGAPGIFVVLCCFWCKKYVFESTDNTRS